MSILSLAFENMLSIRLTSMPGTGVLSWQRFRRRCLPAYPGCSSSDLAAPVAAIFFAVTASLSSA